MKLRVVALLGQVLDEEDQENIVRFCKTENIILLADEVSYSYYSCSQYTLTLKSAWNSFPSVILRRLISFPV